jgi:hypothetical protein
MSEFEFDLFGDKQEQPKQEKKEVSAPVAPVPAKVELVEEEPSLPLEPTPQEKILFAKKLADIKDFFDGKPLVKSTALTMPVLPKNYPFVCNYEPEALMVTEGIHDAFCVGLYFIGTHDVEPELVFDFEVQSERIEKNGKNVPLTIPLIIPLQSLDQETPLRKLVEDWTGHTLTRQELAVGVNMEDFVGKPAFISVDHKKVYRKGAFVEFAEILYVTERKSVAEGEKPELPFMIYSGDKKTKEEAMIEMNEHGIPVWAADLIITSDEFNALPSRTKTKNKER